MEGKELQKHRTKLKSTPFFSLGLVIALSLTLVAFEYRSVDAMVYIPFEGDDLESFEDELVEQVIVKLPEPPKPRIEKPIIKKAPSLPSPTVQPIITTVFKPVSDDQQIKSEAELVQNVDSSAFLFSEEIEEPTRLPEIWPEYPGGEKAMFEYLAKNLKFTQRAKDGNISGKIFVEFVVGKNGKVKDVLIVRGLGFGLDEIALNAFEGMPEWTPGRQNGERVNVKYTIPVNFTLK